MINLPATVQNELDSTVRTITARVIVWGSDSITPSIYSQDDNLKTIQIQRVGDESRFFGFGICQRLNFHLIDMNREINVKAGCAVEIYFSGMAYTTFPIFYVSEVHRDEKTNELSITAYDSIYKLSDYTTKYFDIQAYTIRQYVEAVAAAIGVTCNELTDDSFDLSYPNGANFNGDENMRDVFDSIAEVTTSIYYLDKDNKLTFKQLDRDGSPVLTITKDKYFDLSTKTNRRLVGIAHVTELGDNVGINNAQSGTIQYMRDNPFYELRNDVHELLEASFAKVENLTINQFNCKWRGNFGLEIADKIAIVTKDNDITYSFVLDDVIEFKDGLSESTEWNYENDETELEATPTTLGEVINKTIAKVNKIDKEITLLATQSDDNTNELAEIKITTTEIMNTVEKTEQDIDSLTNNVNSLTNRVNTSVTAEDVQFLIEQEYINGVDKVTTSTGFTFDETGLSISKSGSEMSTQVTEDGMTVYKNNSAILTANNEGVDAVNLHASTYLIVGANSRFEDYDGNRTGCFFIGN